MARTHPIDANNHYFVGTKCGWLSNQSAYILFYDSSMYAESRPLTTIRCGVYCMYVRGVAALCVQALTGWRKKPKRLCVYAFSSIQFLIPPPDCSSLQAGVHLARLTTNINGNQKNSSTKKNDGHPYTKHSLHGGRRLSHITE